MPRLRLTGFLGENRALHPLAIPEGVGVTSLNQKPGRGDLRPWKAPLTVANVPSGRDTIYRMGRYAPSDTATWLSWPTTVHAVRTPGDVTDQYERTYYTGDGVPKWTDSLKLQVAPRLLGVPAPSTAPVVSATGNPYTSVATALIVGEVYTILTTGTTNFTLVGAANSSPGTVFTATGVGLGTGTASYIPDALETRYYVYTYVTDIGEEGPPSAPSAAVSCPLDSTASISSLSAPPSGNYGITLTRIYRTQTGSSGTEFYFVKQISATAGSTSESILGANLGEVLATTTWLPPDSTMTNLTGLWNGMLAGIVGRAIRFCEAYVPYAWPVAYEVLPGTDRPVSMAAYGQTLVVGTDGKPILITGGSPDAMDEQPVEFLQACVAAKSMVSTGHGVAWASPDGLAYVGAGGPRLLTQDVMTRDDWQALVPSTIVGAFFEGRYFGFYNNGSAKGFCVDPANPQGMYFFDFGTTALYVDDQQDALFTLSGTNVQKWDNGSSLTYTFKSKPLRLEKPVVGFAWGQVQADAYPVTFKLYADTGLKHTQTVASDRPFRLPGGYYGTIFNIEMSGTAAVQYVDVAHSTDELK